MQKEGSLRHRKAVEIAQQSRRLLPPTELDGGQTLWACRTISGPRDPSSLARKSLLTATLRQIVKTHLSPGFLRLEDEASGKTGVEMGNGEIYTISTVDQILEMVTAGTVEEVVEEIKMENRSVLEIMCQRFIKDLYECAPPGLQKEIEAEVKITVQKYVGNTDVYAKHVPFLFTPQIGYTLIDRMERQTTERTKAWKREAVEESARILRYMAGAWILCNGEESPQRTRTSCRAYAHIAKEQQSDRVPVLNIILANEETAARDKEDKKRKHVKFVEIENEEAEYGVIGEKKEAYENSDEYDSERETNSESEDVKRIAQENLQFNGANKDPGQSTTRFGEENKKLYKDAFYSPKNIKKPLETPQKKVEEGLLHIGPESNSDKTIGEEKEKGFWKIPKMQHEDQKSAPFPGKPKITVRKSEHPHVPTGHEAPEHENKDRSAEEAKKNESEHEVGKKSSAGDREVLNSVQHSPTLKNGSSEEVFEASAPPAEESAEYIEGKGGREGAGEEAEDAEGLGEFGDSSFYLSEESANEETRKKRSVDGMYSGEIVQLPQNNPEIADAEGGLPSKPSLEETMQELSHEARRNIEAFSDRTSMKGHPEIPILFNSENVGKNQRYTKTEVEKQFLQSVGEKITEKCRKRPKDLYCSAMLPTIREYLQKQVITMNVWVYDKAQKDEKKNFLFSAFLRRYTRRTLKKPEKYLDLSSRSTSTRLRSSDSLKKQRDVSSLSRTKPS